MKVKLWDYPNVGDQINRELIRFILGYSPDYHHANQSFEEDNYLVIGSILKYCDKNSIVWGTGAINKTHLCQDKPKKVYAVRGPLSRDLLLSQGIECPEVYGDPALLLPWFYKPKIEKKYKIGVIFHWEDEKIDIAKDFKETEEVIKISSNLPVFEFIDKINSCEKIVSSSLHGIIVADAYGIPSIRLTLPNDRNDDFKFEDYFLSVKRIPQNLICHRVDMDLSEYINKDIQISPYEIDINLTKLMDSCPFNNHVLAFIPTKDRYFDTLPLAIQGVINQETKPNKLLIYDDSNQPIDLRKHSIYNHLFKRLDEVGIEWQVVFGKKKGQHYGHQLSQEMAIKYVWRLDDDNFPESNVLTILLGNMNQNVGACGGLVLMPNSPKLSELKGEFNDNVQWYHWEGKKEVNHLYSSFLYRKGIVDYELSLSPVAHREETIFTMRLKDKGYKLIVDSRVKTWHYRNATGGIREYDKDNWEHDEIIFQDILRRRNGELVVFLDNGMGDHICFKSIIPELKKKYKDITISCCYPELFKDDGLKLISIQEGSELVESSKYNIYKWMTDNNWKGEITDAFKEMYLNS